MATGDDDDSALQTAIAESMKDRSPPTDSQVGGQASADPDDEGQKPVRRTNIDDRIKEITLQPVLELPLVNDPAGDTWLFIDPPSKQPEQHGVDYASYSKHYETPILVKKETLLRYHAPNPSDGFNFEPLFRPSAQFRIIRRRDLTAQVREDPRIKYVIDLTPPAEEDDAVFLTTELCCTQGVRLWYQSGDIWKVSNMLVGGKEEYASVERQFFVKSDPANSSKAPSPPSHVKDNSDTGNGRAYSGGEGKHKPSTNVLIPLEYSPVRHRSAIERVVAALMGIDPKLDSAPKVWTTYAVANYFCLKNSPVTDYIIRWLRAYPNSFFLEVCPEVSLRIADGLENHDLARDTFAILVGEEALDSLFRTRMSERDNQYSVYGRKKEDLPEKIFSRIEYASKSLQERIRADFKALAGDEMKWVENMPEVQNLLSNEQPNRDTSNALVQLLKDYVRGTILLPLYTNYDYVPPAEFHHPGGDELIRRLSREKVWSDLSVSERLMSRTFWHALVSFTLFAGATNLEIFNGWGMDMDSIEEREREVGGLEIGVYREIQTHDLNALILEGDRLLAEQSQQATFTLPDRTRLQGSGDAIHPNRLATTPYEPIGDLYGAQITSNEEPVEAQRPTAPIDIPQPIPRAESQLFHFYPETSSNDRPPIRDDAAVGPYGNPRQKSVVTKDIGHNGVSRATAIAYDLESARDYSQCSAPSGFSTWSYQGELGAEEGDESQSLSDHRQDSWSTPYVFGQQQETWGRRILPREEIETNASTVSAPAKTRLFDRHTFFREARQFIEATARPKVYNADHLVRPEPHEIGITNTLVCLEDSEWKYLPLWAGGYDDDTGGVFNDQLPTAELAFSTCGPEVHTGITPLNSDKAASEFDMVSSDYEIDTINTSMVNNRSFAGAVNRKHVYAADSIDSSSNDDFDMVTAYEDSVEENAREQMQAQERLEAAEEEAMREAESIEKVRVQLLDENYADLFNDDDDDDDDDDNESTQCGDDVDTPMESDNEDADVVMV